MIADKFNVAHRHALIVRAIGASIEGGVETRDLIENTLESCFSQLRRFGCHENEVRGLVGDALEYQLTLVSGPLAYERCRTALRVALEAVEAIA